MDHIQDRKIRTWGEVGFWKEREKGMRRENSQNSFCARIKCSKNKKLKNTTWLRYYSHGVQYPLQIHSPTGFRKFTKLGYHHQSSCGVSEKYLLTILIVYACAPMTQYTCGGQRKTPPTSRLLEWSLVTRPVSHLLKTEFLCVLATARK